MSSQRGNASRSRSQKHKNTTAYKNDKYGASVQVQKAKSKVHNGLCQRCKEVLEWKVKYNKYKPITQARTCVKCSQKTVKDAYHVICRPCSIKLELCGKCGKKEDIVIPVSTPKEGKEEEEEEEDTSLKKKGGGQRNKGVDEFDTDDDFGDLGSGGDDDDDDDDDDGDKEDFAGDSEPKGAGGLAAVPDVSRVSVQD